MRPHHRLVAWRRAVELVTVVYQATANYPPDERFGLTSQMRRSAVSVPSNIAEGAARISKREKAHFFVTARGSLSELETQIEISIRLRFLSEEVARSLFVQTES